MILVIADDLIGAAEIAGIGHSYGLTCALLTDVTENLPVCDMLVIATDTRSMTEGAAVAETHRICQLIKMALPRLTEARQAAMTPLQRAQAMAHPDEVLHIFKITDPVLRGHVHMELRALVEESRYEQVMYVPANPSKGQVIRGGRYFIDGEPLDQTKYKSDTAFPATTANVAAAIGVQPGSRLRICDAEDLRDMQRVVKLALNNRNATLLAGSADLFCAFLTELGRKPARHKQFPGLSEKGPALIICGSSPSSDVTNMPFVKRREMSAVPMPREVFEAIAQSGLALKDAVERWMGRLKQLQLVSGKATSFVLSIPYTTLSARDTTLALSKVTAEMVQRLTAQNTFAEIVIEGGATALVALQQLGWTRFQVVNQVAPGLIRLHCLDNTHTHVTFKPDGIEWHELLD